MKLMRTCVIRVNSSVVSLMIFALLFNGDESRAGGKSSTDSFDATLEAPTELGFFQTLTGFGGTVSSVPPGIVITYELIKGDNCAEGSALAEIFDQIVVPRSNHTQTFDLFPNDDPVDFALIAQALTDGQPNLFCLWMRFAGPVSGRAGLPAEISVPPDAQILFFRLTVAPFSIIQPTPNPQFFETTPYEVRVAVFGLPSPDPCTLRLEASGTDGTLSLNFEVGTREPATWNVWLIAQAEITEILSAWLAVNDPPAPVHVSIPFFPSLGTIGVLTTLTTSAQGIFCSAFETVNTAPLTMTSAPRGQELQDLFWQHAVGLQDLLK